MRLRSLLLFSLPVALLCAASIAHADTVTYNLLLQPEYPLPATPAIVGTLVLNTPPPASGSADFLYPQTASGPFQLQALRLSVDTDQYDLSDLFPYIPLFTSFQFNFVDGDLTAVSGALSDFASSIVFGTQTINGFGSPLTAEYFDSFGTGSTYLVSVKPASSPATPTPEPSSLALLGTGLLSALGAVRTRFRS